MGLGKTVALPPPILGVRRARDGEPARPSLVVVPRSLVFNWIREAQRFTPNLRVLDYSGPGRRNRPLDSGDVDVVITTYGTLRRDAPELAAVRFDYAILDEAQAIKKAGSARPSRD
jgi:SNF2 family DNA or RNA helicase